MAKWLKMEYGENPFEATPGALRVWGELGNHPKWKMAVGTGNFEFAGCFKLGSAGFELGEIPLGSADDGETREQVLETSHRRACDHHGVRPFKKIVYVGDWVWDVKASKALGWEFIGIASGETAQALRKAGAEIILPDFKGFIPILETL
jgi:phosphoglycolate phosphatase-like HAD superfamily hydrolase